MAEFGGLTKNGEIENKRKYLFVRQKEMLDGFLKNGAISPSQYEFSYFGLITKMNITKEELAEWCGGSEKEEKIQ